MIGIGRYFFGGLAAFSLLMYFVGPVEMQMEWISTMFLSVCVFALTFVTRAF